MAPNDSDNKKSKDFLQKIKNGASSVAGNIKDKAQGVFSSVKAAISSGSVKKQQTQQSSTPDAQAVSTEKNTPAAAKQGVKSETPTAAGTAQQVKKATPAKAKPASAGAKTSGTPVTKTPTAKKPVAKKPAARPTAQKKATPSPSGKAASRPTPVKKPQTAAAKPAVKRPVSAASSATKRPVQKPAAGTVKNVTPAPRKLPVSSSRPKTGASAASTPGRKLPTSGAIPPSKVAPGDMPPTQETVIFTEDTAKAFSKKALKNAQSGPLPDIPEDGSKKKKRHRSIFKPRDKRPNFVLSIILTSIKMSFVAIGLVAVIAVGSVLGVANAYLETTPDLDVAKIEDQSLSSEILTPTGELIAIYTGDENRDWADIEEIPVELRNAFIAVEDIRFYDHDGVDLRRLIGAFVANLESSSVQGGSTITQQLIKNQLLTSERSYKRKLQEAYLAMELEKKYEKDEILEFYLNTIPLGGTVYGVKTAASDYFGKTLEQLTLKEMICIAAITQNPHQYNPRRATYGKGNLLGLINRMNIIAERMYWNEFITEEQFNEVYVPRELYAIDYDTEEEEIGTESQSVITGQSVADDVVADESETKTKESELNPAYRSVWKNEMKILETSPANELYQYPHFIEYVIHDVQSFMLKQQGLEDTKENRQLMDHEMRSNGYRIYTTIDTEMQETVQNTLSEWDDYPRLANDDDSVVERYDSNGNVVEIIQPQAAAVVIENSTGQLKAIVGSRDEPTARRTFNRAYQGQMQVGSSIKPITVYGPALDMGYSPATSVANVEVPIEGWTSEVGHPTTSKGTPGPAPIRQAVVGSWNIAAARTLMDLVGIERSYSYLQKFGVKAPENPDNIGGVGLALGAYPVTPIEMAGAYSSLARGGEFLQPISFTKVVDSNDNIVIDAEEERNMLEGYKPSTAWMMTDMLVEAVESGTGTDAKIDGMTTAGKTGTVMDHRGAFFAGYTPYYTSTLWIGHDEDKELADRSYASSVTAPLWKEYMTKLHEGKADKPILDGDPELDYHLVKGTVCKWSNMAPGGSCETVEDWFLEGTVPIATCDVCYSSGGVYCRDSGMTWVAGYCPEESKYSGSGRNFPEGSPYIEAGYGGGGGSSENCNVHTTPIAPVDDPVTDPAVTDPAVVDPGTGEAPPVDPAPPPE